MNEKKAGALVRLMYQKAFDGDDPRCATKRLFVFIRGRTGKQATLCLHFTYQTIDIDAKKHKLI